MFDHLDTANSSVEEDSLPPVPYLRGTSFIPCISQNVTYLRDTGWVSIDPIDGKRKIWNSGTWDERKTLTKIYNPSTQQYEII